MCFVSVFLMHTLFRVLVNLDMASQAWSMSLRFGSINVQFSDAVFQCVTRHVKRDIYMEITNVPSLLKLLTGKARIKSERCLPSKICTRLVHYTPASLHSDCF